jgi:hypothetical protein
MPPLCVLKPLPKLPLREPSMRIPLLPPLTVARPAASPLPALQRLVTVPPIIRSLVTLTPPRVPPTVANVRPAPQTPAKASPALQTMPWPVAVRPGADGQASASGDGCPLRERFHQYDSPNMTQGLEATGFDTVVLCALAS